jgi:outer membrane protein assembly factor BamB
LQCLVTTERDGYEETLYNPWRFPSLRRRVLVPIWGDNAMRRVITATWSLLVFVLFIPQFVSAEDWPQWLGSRRDSVWREEGIIEQIPKAGPTILWRVPLSGGYSGPAVAAGKVFVLDYTVTGGESKLDFNARDQIHGKERVLCFDAATGKQIWSHSYGCDYNISYATGPRCTPTVADGKVYTLGAEGNLFCLDANSGKPVWSHDLNVDYKAETPMWGFCGHPLVDGKKLICLVGGEGSIAVAFDKDSGKELWRALSAREAGYCPPTIIEAGGHRQLLIWHCESLNSLDPKTGKQYWSVPLAPSYGMSIAAPRKLGDLLFASGIGNVGLALRLSPDKPEVVEAWRGSASSAVYSGNTTPFLENGMIYGCDCQTGHLRGVKLETGERVWETFAATSGTDRRAAHGTAFIVKNGDRFFLFAETGDLIIARLTPEKYDELSRGKLLEPTGSAFGRQVVWSHPAFANKCIFARNDKELVCASLALK